MNSTKMRNIQTLHTHSTNSDGAFSPLDVLAIARKHGISAVAFTDHDSVLTPEQFTELKKVKDIRWVSGIEISAGWPLDLGGGPASGCHIVGLFVDPNNLALKDYCQKSQKSRIERMEKIVKNLHSIGIKITAEDCLRQSKGEVVARPHIVSAILAYPENLRRIEEIIKEMEFQSRNDKALRKSYTLLKKRQ